MVLDDENRPSFFLGNSAVYQFGNNKNAKNAFLFFHGFPADTNKNEDCAQALAHEDGHAYVLHYSGLGASKGKFGLTSSIEESKKLLNFVKAKMQYEHIFVVGHSWGGLVAINLLRDMPKLFTKAALLAPFCMLPDDDVATQILQEFCENQKCTSGQLYNVEELLLDFQRVRSMHAPLDAASALNSGPPIVIIQGTRDVVSIPEGALRLNLALGNISSLIQINDEHHFNDRKGVIRLLKNWFFTE